jgi:hypothetical protein
MDGLGRAVAAAAASPSHGRGAARRRVGCCVVDDEIGEVLATTCNAWDTPLFPNKGVCAELQALAGLVIGGRLPSQPADGLGWTVAVTLYDGGTVIKPLHLLSSISMRISIDVTHVTKSERAE